MGGYCTGILGILLGRQGEPWLPSQAHSEHSPPSPPTKMEEAREMIYIEAKVRYDYVHYSMQPFKACVDSHTHWILISPIIVHMLATTL